MMAAVLLAESVKQHQKFTHELREDRKFDAPFTPIKSHRSLKRDANVIVNHQHQLQHKELRFSETTFVSNKIAQETSDENNNNTTTTTTISNNTNNNGSNTIVRTFIDVPNCPNELLETTRRLILQERALHPECFFEADMDRLMNDDWFLTRFLLRRQEKPDKAVELIKECGLFRHKYNVHPDLTYKNFPSEFFTMAGTFPYMKDRFGNQTLILRAKVHNPQVIAKLNLQMDLKRFLLYSMEQSDRLNGGRGIAVVFDMSQSSLANLDWELLTWMVTSFRHYCPKVLSYILVANAPWFLNGPMKLASSSLLTNGNRKRLKFVQGNEIMDYIAEENLPDFLGGSCPVDYQSISLVENLRSAS